VLVPRRQPPFYNWSTRGIAVGDIDNDGDVDVVSSGCNDVTGTDRSWVHLNDGTGSLVLDNTRFPRSPSFRIGCTLADVDRDGDLDAVFPGQTSGAVVGTLELWLNDGRGYFTEVTATHLPPNTDCESNAAAGDIDGDGFPEIVIGRGNNRRTPKRILWNDGTGRFLAQMLPPAGEVAGCYLFDADRDGDLDVFFKGWPSLLYINERGGLREVFVPTPIPATAYYPAGIGDVNADGYPDLVFGGSIYEPSILLNDGRGNFREATGWLRGDWRRGIETMTFADLDGDGDEDAFADSIVFIFGFNAAVFFNQHRQLWGAQTVARGGTYTLDVSGRRGATLLLAMSTAKLQFPWSLGALGNWHLDPMTTVTLGGVTVDVEGQARLNFPIPNQPYLAGRNLYFQGFDLGTRVPRLEHATNWWGVRIQ
jgi:hypothetical protein